MKNKLLTSTTTVDQILIFFSRLFNAVSKKNISPILWEHPHIPRYRVRIFFSLTLVVIFLGFLALIPSVILSFRENIPAVAVMDIVVYALILLIFFKTNISFEVRVWMLISLFYLLGVGLLILTGPMGAGLVYLFVFPVLSGVLLGMHHAFFSLIINLFTITLMGVCLYAGIPFEVKLAVYPPDVWTIVGINFMILNFIVAAPLAILVEGLEKSLAKEKKARKALREGQKKLLRAKEKAEEADRLKSAFLSNMSHDIRTPMNAIIGFSNLLREGNIEENEQEEFLRHIQNSGTHLLHLIDDIIDISKIEAGQLTIRPSNCRLNDMLRELHAAFALSPRKSKEVEIILSPAVRDDHLTIITDSFRLQQILVNLISNAIKFTQTGSITIGYTFRDYRTLEFFVRDTGMGIPYEAQSHVFERFRKIEHATKLNEGTGLGLAICKSLVEMMGGRIWLDSTPGQGSQFSFILPFTLADDLQEEELRPQKSLHLNWKEKTILIAEDDETSFQLLSRILSKTHAKIIRCKTGQEAVDICDYFENIDLVLMDIQMPNKDGYQALKEIRQKKNQIPVIAQTAFAMAGEMEKGMSAGFNDFLTKPIQHKKLLKTLSPYLI
ncbi:MAG: ATP-binding protein [Bacteroidia bacterium]|nr:ATP-binding protein [Bacteroidia bacterium]